jgi:hypothetical protein
MTRQIKVRSIKRKEIDEDKLALAFFMLAKILREQAEGRAEPTPAEAEVGPRGDPEAA